MADSLGWLLVFALLVIIQNSLYAAFKYNNLKKAIRLNPLQIEGYIGMANFLIDVYTNYHQAARYYIYGLYIQPDNPQLWQELSEMMIQNKIPFDDMYTLIENNVWIWCDIG